MLALNYAQLSGKTSLRQHETMWNAYRGLRGQARQQRLAETGASEATLPRDAEEISPTPLMPLACLGSLDRGAVWPYIVAQTSQP